MGAPAHARDPRKPRPAHHEKGEEALIARLLTCSDFKIKKTSGRIQIERGHGDSSEMAPLGVGPAKALGGGGLADGRAVSAARKVRQCVQILSEKRLWSETYVQPSCDFSVKSEICKDLQNVPSTLLARKWCSFWPIKVLTLS